MTQYRRRNTPAGNTGLAKVAVRCSANTFLVNQSLVLHINICGETRPQPQTPKHYFMTTVQTSNRLQEI